MAKLCAFRALLARLCDHTADFTSRIRAEMRRECSQTLRFSAASLSDGSQFVLNPRHEAVTHEKAEIYAVNGSNLAHFW
jgi:hypothetical protein